MAATNNAVGGKGPCFGRAWDEGTCEGMADTIGPNHPSEPQLADKAQQPLNELWTSAERRVRVLPRIAYLRRGDALGAMRTITRPGVHASSGRPSVSRVPEIGTHGLKGGPALSPMQHNV